MLWEAIVTRLLSAFADDEHREAARQELVGLAIEPCHHLPLRLAQILQTTHKQASGMPGYGDCAGFKKALSSGNYTNNTTLPHPLPAALTRCLDVALHNPHCVQPDFKRNSFNPLSFHNETSL